MSLANIKGLAELQKYLDQFPADVEAGIMRNALRAGMRQVKNKAVINISSDSGDLAKALRISAKLRNGIVSCVLAARGFQGYKAMWLEFGTRPHLISVSDDDREIYITRRGQARRISVSTANRRMRRRASLMIGTKLIGPYVMHPGSRPHPFLRPALDASATDAIIAVGSYIKAHLKRKYKLDTSHITIEEGDD